MQKLPIEEYFKYHPPITPERIALHERVNRESLEICQLLLKVDPDSNDRTRQIFQLVDRANKLAKSVCNDEPCLRWAYLAVTDLLISVSQPRTCDRRRENILMYTQQFRMFLNQGITIDEIEQTSNSQG